jgi:hypothetical protein
MKINDIDFNNPYTILKSGVELGYYSSEHDKISIYVDCTSDLYEFVQKNVFLNKITFTLKIEDDVFKNCKYILHNHTIEFVYDI